MGGGEAKMESGHTYLRFFTLPLGYHESWLLEDNIIYISRSCLLSPIEAHSKLCACLAKANFMV